MKKPLLLLYFMMIPLVHAQSVKVTSGKVMRLSIKSKFIDSRNVDVWLPEDYSKAKKYAVLYMQDGQMLFDPEQTWNKQAWQIDKVAAALMAQKKTIPFIIVGIWNNGNKRHSEYFPSRVYRNIEETQKNFISDILIKKGRIDCKFRPISDYYLKFIVTELKPYIDANFYTYPEAKYTFIAGSSMGGLISMYAVCEYPEVFGGAACMSTHWTGIYQLKDNPIPKALFSYMNYYLPNPKTHKIYFDCGDQTLDTLYPALQMRVDSIMNRKKYSKKNWVTKYFPGHDHSEKSWGERVNFPLEFLLKRD